MKVDRHCIEIFLNILVACASVLSMVLNQALWELLEVKCSHIKDMYAWSILFVMVDGHCLPVLLLAGTQGYLVPIFGASRMKAVGDITDNFLHCVSLAVKVDGC